MEPNNEGVRLVLVGKSPVTMLSSAVHQVCSALREHDLKMHSENREPTGEDYILAITWVQALANAYSAIPQVFANNEPRAVKMCDGVEVPLTDIEETRLYEELGVEVANPVNLGSLSRKH